MLVMELRCDVRLCSKAVPEVLKVDGVERKAATVVRFKAVDRIPKTWFHGSNPSTEPEHLRVFPALAV